MVTYIYNKRIAGTGQIGSERKGCTVNIRGRPAVKVTVRRDNMERQAVIRDLSAEIETLARLHIQHGLQHTQGFAKQKSDIEKLIQDNEVNLKKELDPLVLNLYRRYFG